MASFLAVARTELLLLWRSRGVRAAIPLLALAGMVAASRIREAPWGAWSQFSFTIALATLALTLAGGDPLGRDRERRLDGVLLSTPVPTVAYVLGKYLAAVCALAGPLLVGLLAALLADRFYGWRDPPLLLGRALFPALGARAYFCGWAVLMPVPALFGAALGMCGLALGRGGRLLVACAALAIWLAPLVSDGWPAALDLAGLASQRWPDAAQEDIARQANQEIQARAARSAGSSPSADLLPQATREHLAGRAAMTVPPPLPPGFVWSRGLYLGVTAALLALTCGVVGHRRRRD